MMVLLSTETGVHKHRTTSTVVETEFKHVPGSETRLHNLHRTSTTVKTTLSDLASNETGVHEHRTTSILVEIVHVNFLGTETGLFDFHESKRLYLIFPALKQVSTSITQPIQLSKLNRSKFLVPKHACTPYTGPPRKWNKFIWSSKRWNRSPQASHHLYSHRSWSTFLVPKHACTTHHDSENDSIWASQQWKRSWVHKHHTVSTVVKMEFWHIPGSDTHLPNLHDSVNDFIWSSIHWNRIPQASHNLYSCGN